VTRNRSFNNQAIKRLVADGRAPNDPDLERYPDAAPPEQTISDYFYGDHLHWDSKADVVEERERSPFLDGLFRYEFFKAAAGRHIYTSDSRRSSRRRSGIRRLSRPARENFRNLLAARGLLRPLGLPWRLCPGLRRRLRPLLSRHVWVLSFDVLRLRH
jgi:hypothetical protein